MHRPGNQATQRPGEARHGTNDGLLGLAVPAVGAIIVLAACCAIGAPVARGRDRPDGSTLAGRGPGDAGSLLLEYFRSLSPIRTSRRSATGWPRATAKAALCRLLAESPGVTTRRAAVAALGTWGVSLGATRCSAARSATPTPSSRQLAEDALWSVWFRADTPENNQTLLEVIKLSAGAISTGPRPWRPA